MRLPAPRERWPDRCGKGPSGSPQPPSPPPPAAVGEGGGGGGAPPTHGPPPRQTLPPPARLSCGDPPAGPPGLGMFRWGPHGDFPPTEDTEHEGTPQIGEGAVPNGTPPPAPPPPGPEQVLGARLRHLGDAFQLSYERQRRGGGPFWGPLYRWVLPWLEPRAAPLEARGGN